MRKFNIIMITAIVSLLIWVYWSSTIEYHNTIFILKQKNNSGKEILIEPNNSTCSHVPFLLILVTSYVGHIELRSAHRRAMPDSLLKSMNASRIFLLAKIPQNEKYITQKAIQDESDIFGDILQGSFIEHYRNLTYKHLMGLQWASTICDSSTFILKVDDDTVFNLERTVKLLQKLQNFNKQNFFMGYILNGTMPRRNKENKWYVTQEEYPRNYYPPYLSGWYYITTPSVAARLLEEALYHPYFWIDDIFVTGILTEALSIQLTHLPKKYWLEYYELLECCIKDMIAKSIQCEYVVGPNGNRNNLIVEFNDAIRNCDNWKNCTVRPADQSLNKVCVAYRERSIFSNGQPEVHNIRF